MPEQTKPIHNLYIWRSDWGVIGQQVNTYYFNHLTRWHRPDAIVWLFKGKSAICRVLTTDSGITRGEALKFTTAIMLGQFWVGEFNLDKCVVDWKRSIEKTPRY